MPTRSTPAALLLIAAAGCGAGQPPASTAPTPAETLTAIRIVGLRADAAIAGMPVSLTAIGQRSDGGEAPIANVVWSSSDESTARIDAAGRLSPLVHGTVVIHARAGGLSGSVTIEVVPDLSGTWSVTYVGLGDCDYELGCPSAPVSRSGRVVLTQAGRSIQGVWRDGWVTGHPSFSGIARVDGTIGLAGSRCSISDINRGTLFLLHDWLMRFERRDSFTGGFVWERAAGGDGFRLGCDGEPTARTRVDFRVTRFERD